MLYLIQMVKLDHIPAAHPRCHHLVSHFALEVCSPGPVSWKVGRGHHPDNVR